MPDIDLYTQTPEKYDEFQYKRPDYVGARQAFFELAVRHLSGMMDFSLVDFCCGTGGETRELGQQISLGRATLIDINKDFLKIAVEKGIKAKSVETIPSDILNAKIRGGNDLVISMFAYHHVPDADKARYIAKAKDALKVGGVILLGEIYTPDRQTTLDYYEHLIQTIPGALEDSALQTFLRQTAASEDFEYKVSQKFAHDQLTAEGFELMESKKIWPLDGRFMDDVGTFVEAWKLARI